MIPVLICSLQILNGNIIGPHFNNPDIYIPQSTYRLVANEGKVAHTNHLIYLGPSRIPPMPMPMDYSLSGPLQSGNPSGYHPSDIRSAYNVPANGGSNAIAIVDAYDYGAALKDFNVFSGQFGLPQETSTNATSSSNKVFQVVYQGTTRPPGSASWAEEEALDIEWAHAMAPNAKIYLVEANSPSYADLLAAEQKAAGLPGVTEVSNSWGGGESSNEATAYDPSFVHAGVVFLASAGDIGGQKEYPSTSPNVVGVGGTHLVMSNGSFVSESAWSGSGGGLSSYESRPSYQSGIAAIVGTHRGAPDIAAVADPNTGVAIYDSIPYMGYKGWMVFGGTSVACPVCAGIINTAGSAESSSSAELTKIYGGLGGANFRDITSGSAGSFSAKVGWDFITGVGAPKGTAGL